MIYDDLLELADHLARRESRRPKQVSLRRAVSSAYYAVFHALAYSCADALVGWSKPWHAVTPIYRSLDHSGAKRLFERDRSGTVFGPDIAAIGRDFIFLQQARHTADYDPQPLSFGRNETIELIGRAQNAVRLILAIPSDARLVLAVNLIAKQR
jgi:hypothetical protein